MKNKFIFLNGMMAFAILNFTSCKDDSPEPEAVVLEVQSQDIPADVSARPGAQPNYTFFSLRTSTFIDKTDSNSLEWDIALAGTTILVNGGTSGPGQGAAVIVDNIFEDVSEAPADGYVQDSESGFAIPKGSGNGWYNYTGEGNPPHAILPIPGKVIILKTADGNYAKMEILSYYKGNPDTSAADFINMETRALGKYYTIRYVVQSDGSREF